MTTDVVAYIAIHKEYGTKTVSFFKGDEEKWNYYPLTFLVEHNPWKETVRDIFDVVASVPKFSEIATIIDNSHHEYFHGD